MNDDEVRKLHTSAVALRISGAAASLLGLCVDPSNFKALSPGAQAEIVNILIPLSKFATDLGKEVLSDLEKSVPLKGVVS